MAHWFLSTRAQSVGGSAVPVKVLNADRPGATQDLLPELQAEVQGRDVFFATHGFEVDQASGLREVGVWLDNLQIGNAVKIGILWPGDAALKLFVDYIVEGREAIQSGKYLADFLNNNFGGAVSISFASHSLGARVVLQTIAGLADGVRVRRVVLMAGAIDSDCLMNEYKSAARKVEEISLLASTRDEVLAFAFPLGNPLMGIIDRWHPYYRAALGHKGPAQPFPTSPPLQANWQIPANCAYGHHNYLPGGPLPAAYALPVDIPPDNGPTPPAGTPPALAGDESWKPAWSAGFASTRYT
ncbi:MAG: hypothetical protein NVS9B14_16960 [Candidatus Acidiferrum sp.]